MYYFIAQITLEDLHEYQKYLDRADAVFQKYNGRYLVVDNQPDVLEGKWDYSRAVLIQFESKEDFNSWYYSIDYQKILIHRLKGAACDTILVKGLD
jgi:uncharacterized protein (DUF1330 family)